MTGESPASKIISFLCLNCGSPIPVHLHGQSLTFACPSCGAIVQEDNDGLKVLIQASQSHKATSLIELGSKADFRGSKWQVIGYMSRSDEQETFFWHEYLLFNPREGFRFLMSANGHWNFLSTTKKIPVRSLKMGRVSLKWAGIRYDYFYGGVAVVQSVLGEFYWRVQAGDRAKVADYIAPPDLLSSEESDGEIIWTSGTYIPHTDIAKSFKLIGSLPEPSGIAPNQPSRYRPLQKSLLWSWIAAAALLGMLQLYFAFSKSNTKLLDYSTPVTVGQNMLKTPSFEIKDDKTNFEIEISAALYESWMSVTGTMVPESGQNENFGFQKELARYSDGDGGTEGDNSVSLFFPRMAKGTYHIDLQTERDIAPSASAVTMTIKGVEDPPLQSVFWACLGLITLYPLFFALSSFNFETKRWKETSVGSES